MAGYDDHQTEAEYAVASAQRRAAQEAGMVEVKVKPLEWVGHPSGKPLWRAHAPNIGWYGASAIISPASWQFDGLDETVTYGAADIDAAKAAAQADYERRILSALVPSPSPDMQDNDGATAEDVARWKAAIPAAAESMAKKMQDVVASHPAPDMREAVEAELAEILRTSFRRLGGIPSLARASSGADKIINVAAREAVQYFRSLTGGKP